MRVARTIELTDLERSTLTKWSREAWPLDCVTPSTTVSTQHFTRSRHRHRAIVAFWRAHDNQFVGVDTVANHQFRSIFL